jgi:zinc transport system permease protein
MLELFTYDFIVRAFVVGIVTAITAAILGNFVVAARQSVMSDMLAHAALAGVGLGIFLHVSPSFLAGGVAIVASVLLWFLTQRSQRAPEAVAMLLLTGGLAIALLLAHAAKDNPISFESFLFGSILTITASEVVLFSIICAFIVAVLLVWWRSFLVIVFDAQFARVQLRRAAIFEILLMVLTGLLVAVSLKVIGGLLVGALLVIPVLAAQNLAQSFRANVLWSVGIGVVGVISGITASFYVDIPASSGIVLSLIGFFCITFVLQRMSRLD